MWYVYLLVNEEDKHYIGMSNDVERRLGEHNLGKSEYTKGHKWQLVYYEAYFSKKDAIVREKRLKQDGRAKYALMQRVEESERMVKNI